MRLSSTLASVLFIGGALAAQNEVMLKATAVSFTSRGNLGTGSGELLQGFHSTHWRALGEANPTPDGKIIGFRGEAFQDQDRTTAEKFQWVVRSGTDAAGPTTGAAGEIFVSGGLALGPATGTGPVAFNVTTALTTPVDVPCERFFAVGVRLPASPNWTADGHSVWASTQASAGAGAQTVDMAWQIVGAATSAIHPSAKRSWRIGFNQKPAALQLGHFVGTGAAGYGQGGIFPTAGTDGVSFRVNAKGLNGQFVAVFIAPNFAQRKLPILGGKFALDLATVITTPITSGLVAADKFEDKTVPLIPASLTGDYAFQAALFDLTSFAGSLTNAVKLEL